MSDLVGNHIVGFPTRRLKWLMATRSLVWFHRSHVFGSVPFDHKYIMESY